MENKEENCKQLLKKYHDLHPKTSKANPGSESIKFCSNSDERKEIVEKLNEECWDSIKPYWRSRIEKEYCQDLYSKYMELKGKTKTWIDLDGNKNCSRNIAPKDMQELDETIKKLKQYLESLDCQESLSNHQIKELMNDDDSELRQIAVSIFAKRNINNK